MRNRTVKAEAQFGGDGCSGSLSEVNECSAAPCFVTQSVNCKWMTWGDWSDCDGSGQRKRVRSFTEAKEGGSPCSGDMQEVKECKASSSCEKQEKFCLWSSWSPWSSCSKTCGTGSRRQRTRSLVVADKPPHGRRLQGQLGVADELHLTEAPRTQELLLAFALGFLVLGFLPIVGRRLIPRLLHDRGGDRSSLDALLKQEQQELPSRGAFEVA